MRLCFCLDLSMLLNFWISSCMLNGVIGHPSLRCCHHHFLFLVLIISLLSLFHGFSLCLEQNIYRNIPPLKSLWNYLFNMRSFIENGVQTRELCSFYFSVVCCPKLISGRVALGDSGITACRNLLLSWFLICRSRNFIGLLNIQKYSVFSFEITQKFDEINSFLCIDPEMLMILIILSSRMSCCTSVLKIQDLPHT
jgi:hypothetical protein